MDIETQTLPPNVAGPLVEDRSPGSNIELVDDQNDDVPDAQPQPTPRYPSRTRQPPNYFAEYISH